MVRPRLERIQYPAVRDLLLNTPTTDTPPPNFWTLDHDRRDWLAQGKAFSLHQNDRTYAAAAPNKSGSATDFYNTDQGAKITLSHKVQRSPYRYVAMRTNSADRTGPGSFGSTPDRVGPGTYGSAHGMLAHQMPRSSPGGSSFASGAIRSGTAGYGASTRPAEPGYGTIHADTRAWTLHQNFQPKGTSFERSQRWPRPPGPGSNRVSDKATPGPGTYGKLHSWPEKGFRGSARGYNHIGR